MAMSKDWRVDIAPLLFFATVIGLKTYYLIGYLQESRQLLELIGAPGTHDALDYHLTGHFSHTAYYITALAFDVLIFYSLLVRRGAKSRPQGFWENIFPLITVFVPMLGLTLMFIPDIRAHLPGYPESLLRRLGEQVPAFPFYLNMAGLVIGLLGALFSIWAITHLRASFGLRAAVRELVTTGPYRRIRHPLYVGEIIHVFGVVILAATPVALYLFIVAVMLQVIRAKIEERKFLASEPAYAEFRRNTGFLWPKLFVTRPPEK